MKLINENEKTLLTIAMLRDGVIPIENTVHDMNRSLDSLSKDDSRKTKRKFRKLWRKLAKADVKRFAPKNQKLEFSSRFGFKGQNPSREQREARKDIVQHHYLQDVVRPILHNFSQKTSKKPT